MRWRMYTRQSARSAIFDSQDMTSSSPCQVGVPHFPPPLHEGVPPKLLLSDLTYNIHNIHNHDDKEPDFGVTAAARTSHFQKPYPGC